MYKLRRYSLSHVWNQADMIHTSLRAVQADQLLTRVTVHINNNSSCVNTQPKPRGVILGVTWAWCTCRICSQMKGKALCCLFQIACNSSVAAEADHSLQCLSSTLHFHTLNANFALFVQQTDTVCKALKTWHYKGHQIELLNHCSQWATLRRCSQCRP